MMAITNTRKATDVDLMEFAHTAAMRKARSFRSPVSEWPTTLFHVGDDGQRHISGLHRVTTQARAALFIQVALRATRSVEALLMAAAWEAFVPRDVAGATRCAAGRESGVEVARGRRRLAVAGRRRADYASSTRSATACQ
jgi:hypothetical protein